MKKNTKSDIRHADTLDDRKMNEHARYLASLPEEERQQRLAGYLARLEKQRRLESKLSYKIASRLRLTFGGIYWITHWGIRSLFEFVRSAIESVVERILPDDDNFGNKLP
ncbi:MAG: hypothetical protein AAF787_12850 [Chloroflexota bacterium]